MPLYRYRCLNSDCRHEFAIIHAITRSALKKCPLCTTRKLQRLMPTSVQIHFKGHWGDKRRKVINDRKKRQAARIDHKLQTGELTPQAVDFMDKLRKKYGHKSPYLTDPNELKPSRSTTKPRDHNIKYNAAKPLPEPSFYGFDTRAQNSKQRKGPKSRHSK